MIIVIIGQSDLVPVSWDETKNRRVTEQLYKRNALDLKNALQTYRKG